MDKYEYIVNLAEKTAKRVSQNRESWMKFLTSAARIYKYPFKEQLLIYAQNPDATACASIEIWNKRMNCWVNKGSSGIALPDDTATYGHKLKYVFDVSNVHAVKPNGRYPKAWKLREEHKSDVLHRLEQIYGSTDSTKPFEERIIEISDQLAADAYTELQIDYPDLQDRIGFDKLSEQDFALCLKKLISESVSFTILSACEIEISDHEFSFDYINQFVSIKTLSVLGTKINDSARGVLAEIGKTVRIYDKLREKEQEKEISKKELANAPQPRYNALKRESLQEGNSKDKDNIEGGKQNGPGIRTDGRLSDSETESKSGTGGNGNEIRTSEGQISEGEIRWGENSNVSGRNAESTSSRDSGTGKREDGSPDIPDGGERRSKRTAQSTGSDALGEEDEQHPEPGGGSRTERTDLQPTNFVKPEESYTQLSLFPSAEEQRGSITAAEASKKYTMPAAFYLPETDLEVIIRSGGGQKDSRKRIYAKYTEGKSTDEIIAFLKKEYSQVGKGFELHGHPISVWFDENGMTAGYGMQAAESVVTTLSWDQIEKYIHAMITYGLYMDANEAALVDKTEMERTSQKYRMEDNIVQHYPRQIVMVKELIEKLEQDIALYEQNAATSKDKFHMQVGSGVYDTRKDAGNAIIKFFQTDADGTAKIGTYLGFSMNIAFDSFNRKFVLRLKGAMNHPVEIGPDPVGNIIRLNNVLKTMPDKLAEAKDRLETLTNQLESAKIEVTKPFQQEEELAEKLKRLAELNALLNMDEKGTDALILEDDEQPAIVNSDMAVTPITSVKTKPMLKKKVVGLCL